MLEVITYLAYFALFDVLVQWTGFIVSAILQSSQQPESVVVHERQVKGQDADDIILSLYGICALIANGREGGRKHIRSRDTTEKFFDLIGSLTFLCLATISLGLGGILHERQVMVTTLVCLWSVRLGTFLLMRVLMAGQDSRFNGVRTHPPTLFGYWTIQAVWIFGVSLPVLLVNLSSQNLPWLTVTDILGMLLWGTGFLLEAVSDYQKHIFREDDANKGKWINTGLWSVSRHPNYLGEILVWWGVYFTALGGLQGWRLLGLVSPSLTTFMLLYVSGIPMLEKAADSKWGGNPEYVAYKKRTPVLVPWLFTRHEHHE